MNHLAQSPIVLPRDRKNVCLSSARLSAGVCMNELEAEARQKGTEDDGRRTTEKRVSDLHPNSNHIIMDQPEDLASWSSEFPTSSSRSGLGKGRGRRNVKDYPENDEDDVPPPAEPNPRNQPPEEFRPLQNFFSFNSETNNLPIVPPVNMPFTNPKDRTYKRGMALVTPGAPVDSTVDPEKLYVDEYQNAYKKRVDDIDRAAAALKISDPENPTLQFLNSESGHDTSLLGTVPGKGPLMVQDDDIWDRFDMEYYHHLPQTSRLSVFKHKTTIMAMLNSQQVTIVEGYTGCGKTTQIPQYILEEAARKGKTCNIVVTQPRRIAAISVAQRVCDERGWAVGSLVGYQVGLSKRCSPDTRLTYMTTGILLQTLISRKTLEGYTHIIVDEVHERDLETDLLLLVIKKLMVDRADKITKIILMSATLNREKFVSYFPKWQDSEAAGTLLIPQDAVFPITEHYLDTLPGDMAVDIPDENFDEPKLRQFCYEGALKIILSLDALEASGPKRSTSRGGVLVFLPGMMEIETLYKMLLEHAGDQCEMDFEKCKLKWLTLPLHSMITAEDQYKVFTPVKPGFRKVILATNIAESSITVTDITYVIDFCLTKSLSCDPQTNYSCLRLEWASKNQCTQRKGRVGRVAEGVCYRMVPIKFYNSLMQEALPDMEKSCLENVVLHVKNLNLGSPKSILALSIDPPKLKGIRLAVSNLKEVGALTISIGNHYTGLDGDMTQMGFIMAKLPFDIRLSRLIVLGHVFGVLEESIIIAAGLSVKSPFSYPFHRRLTSYMSKIAWSGETYSDCFALLALYRTWRQKHEAHFFRTRHEEKTWAKIYFVQLNVMSEIHTLIQDISRRLRNVNIEVQQTRLVSDTLDSEQGLILKVVIAGAFYPNYFLRHRPVQKDYERTVVRELAGYDPMLSVVFNGFPSDQPGQLYTASIASHFMYNNCIPYVYFHSSKVVVSSDRRSARIGLVSQNVYRGIKMRQLRESVTIKMLRGDVAHDILRNELEKENNSNRLQCPSQVPLPSIKEEDIEIVITHFSDIENFWAVYKNKHKYLNQINTILAKNANNLRMLPTSDIVPGVLCIAEDDGEFFRARVDFNNGSEAMVYCVDYGKSIWRKLRNILAFNEDLIYYELHTLEQQAMQFRIQGIKPLARYSSLWGSETARICRDFIASFKNNITARVFSVVDSVIACDLMGSPHSPSLREALLEDRRVVRVEESRESRDNNNARHMVKVAMSCREEEVRNHNARQVTRMKPPVIFVTPTEGLENEITLRGPFSPLEMNFSSLCRGANMKQVMVEGCSVNSVALDQEPLSHTARLLVAANVGIAHRSGSILAKDSTLMPAVPGLVGLLTMIFCPKVELRYHNRLQRYTGCLSGLGIDPATKLPVYGDHDVEIVFDTMFDNDDLNRINSIRMSMNLVLQNVEEFDIQTLRGSVRNELQDLLERDRDSVEEEYPSHSHFWGLLHEADFLPVPGSDSVRRSGWTADVFPLHHPVDPNAVSREPEMKYGDNAYGYRLDNPLDWNEDAN